MFTVDTHSVLGTYSLIFNSQGGWNKLGGGAKISKSINMEVGINVEGRIFRKKLIYICNKGGNLLPKGKCRGY